eukprot:CAMPEP_0116546286 /NCGR_PEP_ID=MMETSP0397-20121206/3147_1 /TAXON_ID=216820 /ORGANISM="Cyclophora tenuis, Strain ECT3854" /LENGTH=298 /DNA_ID=CAMNT_0004070709 /DNA_START=442 /DNA_END=1341 /DNA_ORIENTATION=-
MLSGAANTARRVFSASSVRPFLALTSSRICGSQPQPHQVSHPHPRCHDQHQRRWRGRKASKKGQNMQDDSVEAGKPSVEIQDPLDEELLFDDEIEDFGERTEGDDDEDVPSLPDPQGVEVRMMQVVERLAERWKSIRGGEPTPALFESIPVAAYDDMVPLQEVAQVVIVSPTLAQVTPYDPSLTKEVRVAIRDALEVNPQTDENDPNVVSVKLPRVSLETRQKTVKQMGKQAEAARKHIRNLRRKAMDVVKQGKDGKLSGISQDDAFRVGKQIDTVCNDAIQALNQMFESKQDSILNL